METCLGCFYDAVMKYPDRSCVRKKGLFWLTAAGVESMVVGKTWRQAE